MNKRIFSTCYQKLSYWAKCGTHQRRARMLASGDKRLDLSSAQIAQVLHLSDLTNKFPIRDKVCLEIGSGWVLSHAIVLYLLGAKRVIATDIQRIAYPSNLYQSIHCSTLSIIRDILSPFEEHDLIRYRLNKLLDIKTFSFDVLKDLGIEYVAPIDLVTQPLDTKIDFAFSFSVLEHVPITDVLPLLENISSNLSNEGKMIHSIHLEDHKDFANFPFDFLSEPEENFSREIQSKWGNRIRCNQWNDIINKVKDMNFNFIYKWSRRDKKIPAIIDPSIQYVNDEDLIISHVGIFGEKKK